MVHDIANNCVRSTYPVIGDITKLKDNRLQVIGMEAGLEKRLIKSGELAEYNNQFQDYIDRGVLEQVSLDEIEKYKENGGYVNYIGHHGVRKDTSNTTPLRLVANSALKNCSTGPSVNDLWPKGPTVYPTCSWSLLSGELTLLLWSGT